MSGTAMVLYTVYSAVVVIRSPLETQIYLAFGIAVKLFWWHVNATSVLVNFNNLAFLAYL